MPICHKIAIMLQEFLIDVTCLLILLSGSLTSNLHKAVIRRTPRRPIRENKQPQKPESGKDVGIVGEIGCRKGMIDVSILPIQKCDH
jgi:hypothetical protein